MRTEEILHSPYPFQDNYMVVLEMDTVVDSRRKTPQYNFYVGNNTKRIFQHTTLPTFIKLKLAMVNSFSKKDWNSFKHDDTFTELDFYTHYRYTKNNPEFKHIGWCVSDSIYVIVMSEDELSELKGISIDPRKESQRESQTHTQRT